MIEKIFAELLKTPINQLMGYFILVTFITFLFILTVINRKDLWRGVKGKNGILDEAIEVLTPVYIILLLLASFADIFLQLKASSDFWDAMEIILFLIVLHKSVPFLNARFGNVVSSVSKIEKKEKDAVDKEDIKED